MVCGLQLVDFVQRVLPNHRMGRDSNICECGKAFDLRGMFTVGEQWAAHIIIAAMDAQAAQEAEKVKV